MNFSRYEKYKDSGLPWLGEIPESWEVKRLKDDVLSNYKALSDRTDGGLEIQYVDISSVEIDGVINDPEKILFKDAPSRARRIVRKNDVIISTVRTYLKAVAYFETVTDNLICSTGFSVLSPCKTIYPTFLKYVILSENFIDKVICNSKGVSYPAINNSELTALHFIAPALKQQIAIANYLDEKTAQIDKETELLQAKKETYRELRKTLINEAVTGRLSVSSEQLSVEDYKDSGVEWLGKIPKHWVIKRVKDIFNVGRGRVIGSTKLEKDGKYPVFSSQTENSGCLGYINTYDFDANILTWTTDGVNAGTIFLRTGKFNCTNICGTLFLKDKKNNNLNYLEYSVQLSAKHNRRIDTNGAKIMNNEMSFILIVLPPKAEQIAIADYLDEKTQKIDSIISVIDKNIAALHEFRKTLINDTVTGKIKVEGERLRNR